MQVRALVPLIALAAFAVVPAHAQIVINTKAGVHQNDGSYLWQYKVTNDCNKPMDYFVLGVCEKVFQSILPGSVTGGIHYSWVNNDPGTGASGIKFDADCFSNDPQVIGFRVGDDFGSRSGTATIKSGRQSTSETVVLAKCPPNRVPEPGTLALALVGLVPLARRRRH